MKIPIPTFYLKEVQIFGKKERKGLAELPLKPVTDGYISSPYGWRMLGGKKVFHAGIDITVYGDKLFIPVYAAYSGKISWIDRSAEGSFGNVVYVQLQDGWYSVYPHLRNVRSDLKVGQTIKQGHELGIIGNTGNVWARDENGVWGIRHNPGGTDGIHLHYEERPTMGAGGARNPIQVANTFIKET
jgi:murein DD-endopeptidase MepM/ murein hydrolase activator NlpD